ncbi:MAG: aminodeoxychorismate lyase [Steroidobacterales bacterium]
MTEPVASVWVDGIATASMSVHDRGLAYGDGLFETMRLRAGAIVNLERHLARLAQGCETLEIQGIDPAELRLELGTLADAQPDGTLKLVVTRGAGSRGYRPPRTARPTRVLMWSPARAEDTVAATNGVRVRLCRTPATENSRLAGLKHLNRLDNVLARAEWSDEAIAEGLMRDSRGAIVGGTMSNLFAVRGGTVVTPRIERAGVRGVQRARVIEATGRLQLRVEELELAPADLTAADELFLTNAVIGIWPIAELDGRGFAVGSTTRRLQRELEV